MNFKFWAMNSSFSKKYLLLYKAFSSQLCKRPIESIANFFKVSDYLAKYLIKGSSAVF